jgi:hypothetical protein
MGRPTHSQLGPAWDGFCDLNEKGRVAQTLKSETIVGAAYEDFARAGLDSI